MKDDVISRQAAVSRISDLLMLELKGERLPTWNEVYNALGELPSAHHEIIHCKDCKWFNDIGCAIRIVDDTDKPSEEDYCSFADRRQDGTD